MQGHEHTIDFSLVEKSLVAVPIGLALLLALLGQLKIF